MAGSLIVVGPREASCMAFKIFRYIVDLVSSVGNVLDWDPGQTQKRVTGKLKHQPGSKYENILNKDNYFCV